MDKDAKVPSFTPQEIAYIRTQTYGRLATVDARGEPHVTPVGFFFDAENGLIDIVGRDMGNSRKYRNVQRNGRVAFVIDDIPCRDPETVRAVVVRGTAQALVTGGRSHVPVCADEMIRIHPARVVSWGLTDASHPEAAPTEAEGAEASQR
ncbi:PPOX class F420-dependent oxidoreductase [Streptomyces halobius]|uniref:PPOX class F420-dependent oxidoreductase n=1 Tax=Streptomyces halobius TaxID=2879846 RepID=A0ABY4M5Z4_9ACTN|nr:PPOX class F420-dependent oxidoreductase [Streptomyces halobius]UQA92608.1 PPOX class F420-dependent oxidoreductase [Streptomyces halobius]